MSYQPEDDEAGRLLRGILSPVEAQSLVPSPPTHAPASGPGVSTPVSGSLATAPSQATPSRSGLAGYFSAGPSPVRSGYVKVLSHGQVGYLPAANLPAAREIDPGLKVLEGGR